MSFGVADDELTSITRAPRPTACSPPAAHDPAVVSTDGRGRPALPARGQALLAPPTTTPRCASGLVGARPSARTSFERLIVPQASDRPGRPTATSSDVPRRFLVEFFDTRGCSLRNRPNWRVVRGGSRRYVDALVAPFGDRLRLATPIASDRGASRTRRDHAPRGEPECFRRGGPRHPLRPGAGHAGRPHRRRARDPLGDPVPAQRGRPAHRSPPLPSAAARGRLDTTRSIPTRAAHGHLPQI